MKYLVIGGTGYIGSCLCEELVASKKENDNIVVIDNFSSKNSPSIVVGTKIYRTSTLDSKKISKIFKKHKFDFVFYLGNKNNINESIFQPTEYFANHITGLTNVINAMKDNSVKNIIYLSSASVYGIPSKNPITEKTPTNPITPHGHSKLASENLLKACKDAFGINYGIIRCFNIIGASKTGKYGCKNNYSELIPNINWSLIMNNKFKIFGNDYKTKDKTCVRDYLDVNDLVEILIKLKNKMIETNNSYIFNAGSAKPKSILDIIKITENTLNQKLEYEFVNKRSGDVGKLYTKNDLISSVLDWKQKHSIEESIRSDYEFRIKNKLDVNYD